MLRATLPLASARSSASRRSSISTETRARAAECSRTCCAEADATRRERVIGLQFEASESPDGSDRVLAFGEAVLLAPEPNEPRASARRASAGCRLAAAAVAACRLCAIGSDAHAQRVRRRRPVRGADGASAKVRAKPRTSSDGRSSAARANCSRRCSARSISPREDVFICNTVKCRPTLDDGDAACAIARPTPARWRIAAAYLDEQIEIIRPRVILALGAPAAKSFIGEQFSITKQRGQWFEGPLGIPLIATFHPAYIFG